LGDPDDVIHQVPVGTFSQCSRQLASWRLMSRARETPGFFCKMTEIKKTTFSELQWRSRGPAEHGGDA
jgi:hypothetical protein